MYSYKRILAKYKLYKAALDLLPTIDKKNLILRAKKMMVAK